jgi:hypothetical protein
MNIKEEIKEDIAILTVTGDLMSGPDVLPFHTHIKKLVTDGTSKIIVDFSNSRSNSTTKSSPPAVAMKDSSCSSKTRSPSS